MTLLAALSGLRTKILKGLNATLTIKHWMRIAQKRTIDDACDHIGHLVRSVMSDECSNYFVNAGYASIKK